MDARRCAAALLLGAAAASLLPAVAARAQRAPADAPAPVPTTSPAPATSRAADDQNEALRREVEALRAEVGALRALRAREAAAGPAVDPRDAAALADAVLRDADARSNPLALADPGSNVTAGWQKDKFYVSSADGNWSISPGIHAQFRFVTNYRQGADPAGDDKTDSGFEYRRLKLTFDGTAITRDLAYGFVWATDRKTGELVNEEAWARYHFLPEWYVRLGQFKENITQEQGISYRRQAAVERTMLNELLNGGEIFVQGVELMWETEPVRVTGSFHDGIHSRNTNFQDYPTNPYNFGANGRAEWKVFGDWKDYADFSAMPASAGAKKDLLAFSAAFEASQAGDTTWWRHGIDGQYETGPLSFYLGYLGRFTVKGAAPDTYDWGVMAQGSYLVTPQVEVFARYDYTYLQTLPGGQAVVNRNRGFHEITAGMSYYLKGHTAKFTLDVSWYPNGSPSNLDSAGILVNDGDDQFTFRAQFQLIL